jgi:iron(III) transport system permease protein
MIWIALILVAVLCLAPIGALLAEFHWSGFFSLLKSPFFLKSVESTLSTGVSAALISVCIALYFARQFALYKWFGQRRQRLLLLVPYLVPNFILAMSFVLAENPGTGLLNSVLKFPEGLYGRGGLITLFSIVHMPVAFLLLEEKFRRIDSSLRESARLSGASSSQVFFTIEAPLLIPSIVSAVGLCFALNISAFAIPAWIGAPAHVYLLTYKVYQAIQLGGADGLGEASLYGMVLLVLAIVPFALGFLVQKNEKKYVLLSGKSSRQVFAQQSKKTFLIFQIIFLIFQITFWFAPLFCLFLSTIVKPGCLQETGLQCLRDATLSHYVYVMTGLDETWAAAKGSLVYGSLSALIILALAITIVFIFSRRKNLLNLVESIAAAPLATPGAIIALGLIIVAGGRFGFNLYNTPWIVVLAFVIKHLSFAVSPLKAGLKNISGTLFEAARVSGASELKIWKLIVLPLLQPEILGGFFLVLVPILGELTMSVFLSSPSFRSFGTVLFDLQDYADQASAGALALLLVALILVLNGITRILSGGKLGY